MLKPARLTEREKATQRSLRKIYRKEKGDKQKGLAIKVREKRWQTGKPKQYSK